MTKLDELQHHFLHYLLGQASDIERHIESTPVLSAAGRLNIYANGYKLRLKEAITTDYEKLHGYLGDEQFDSVMERYIEKYPSHQTNLRYYSVNMPQLLQDETPFNSLPVLAELATIEQAFANSFDAKDVALVTIEDLAALAPEAWATLQFTFQKSVQILSLNYNSFPIWKALAAEETPPDVEQADQSNSWIVWRQADLISHYRPLATEEAAVIELAMQGKTFADICEKLLDFFDEQQTPIKAIGFLQSWIQEEMLAGFDYE